MQKILVLLIALSIGGCCTTDARPRSTESQIKIGEERRAEKIMRNRGGGGYQLPGTIVTSRPTCPF